RLVIRTCAPTTEDPDGSVMVPLNVARASCAGEGLEPIKEIARRPRAATLVFLRFIVSSRSYHFGWQHSAPGWGPRVSRRRGNGETRPFALGEIISPLHGSPA